jgi:hypothetical protein
MAIVRLLLLIGGVLAVLIGLLWIGQGTGYVRWPASSFMIGMAPWTTRGAILAAAGAVAVWLSRRIGR